MEIYDPSIHPCKYCGKPSNGSVGHLYDRSYVEWVCEYCYTNVLKMKSLVQIAEENMKNEFNNRQTNISQIDSTTEMVK